MLVIVSFLDDLDTTSECVYHDYKNCGDILPVLYQSKLIDVREWVNH